MALITCKDCQKEFSTDAKACPHCGAKAPLCPIEPVPMLIIIASICLFLFAYFDTKDDEVAKPEEKAPVVQTIVPNDQARTEHIPAEKPKKIGYMTYSGAGCLDEKNAGYFMVLLESGNITDYKNELSKFVNGRQCIMLRRGQAGVIIDSIAFGGLKRFRPQRGYRDYWVPVEMIAAQRIEEQKADSFSVKVGEVLPLPYTGPGCVRLNDVQDLHHKRQSGDLQKYQRIFDEHAKQKRCALLRKGHSGALRSGVTPDGYVKIQLIGGDVSYWVDGVMLGFTPAKKESAVEQ